MNDESAIAMTRVSFSYDASPLLTNVSLTIPRRDFVCVIGPNGGGKTTLIRLVLGLVKAQRGEVRVLGESPENARRKMGYMPQHAQLDPQFPAKSFELNWELCETLGFLQSPTVAAKALALMASAPTQEEQIEYARSIRFVKAGWTPALHAAYFEWFLKAASYTGGSSFEKFLEFIRNDAVASLTDAERTEMAELLARKPVKKPVLENLAEVFNGRPTKTWTLDELSAASVSGYADELAITGRAGADTNAGHGLETGRDLRRQPRDRLRVI